MANSEEVQLVRFNGFFQGLAPSKFIGVAGSVAKAVGVDIRSEPGIAKAQFKLSKDSGATVVDKVMVSVHTSSGHSYHFGDAGKVYKRTSGGSWSVLATVTGTPKILGAAEHSDGFVYFTYSNKVGRVQISDDTVTEDWNTLTNTNTNYGQVFYHEKQDIVLIGNQELVAKVSAASAFTANALDLLAKYEVRDIAAADVDVLVGATELGNTQRSRIFQWNGSSTTWDFSWMFNDSINWMQNKGEDVLISAGGEGRIYRFPDLQNPETTAPGDYLSTAILDSDPNSKVIFNGLLMFGMYDGSSGNPAPNGVYTYGSRDIKLFPNALMCEYVISQSKTSGIEIGGLSTDGSNLFVGWKDGSTYGVDKIDFSNRYASAFIEFMVINIARLQFKEWIRFPAVFRPLPASTSLEVKQARDHASSFTSAGTIDTDNNTDDDENFTGEGVEDSRLLQLRIEFTVSGTDTPELEELGAMFYIKDEI